MEQDDDDVELTEADFNAAMNWDDDTVASLTRDFVLSARTSKDAWNDLQILSNLGDRTHATVLGFLRDSALYRRLVTTTGRYFVPEAPFNRACLLLGESRGPETVDALAPFLNDPSEEIRKDAARAIARTGAVNMTPMINQALSDHEELVRSRALSGLKTAVSQSGLPAGIKEDLYSAVLRLLQRNQNAEDAASTLYCCDSAKAIDFFCSNSVFTAQSPIIDAVLRVLANEKCVIAPDKLKCLITDLERTDLQYSRSGALGTALRLLGQQQRDEDRDFIRDRLTHMERAVAEGAAEGLVCSFGLDGFEQKIFEVTAQSGYESLNRNQQLYSAVWICNIEINNGGFSQYFSNSSGDTWPDAVACLEAMGFHERLAILREAIDLFGEAGPSTDRSTRQDQLDELLSMDESDEEDDDESIFDALQDRYYNSSEVFEVFTCRFVLGNAEDFR